MADAAPEGVSSAALLLVKRVQDMVLQDAEPPQPYICRKDKENIFGLAPIPTINLDFLAAASSPADSEQLRNLRTALCDWGCFQAVGHGISSSLLDEIRNVAKEFFKLPMEEKKKYAKGVDELEGYGADPVPEEGQPLDWQDRLFLAVYPEDQRKLDFWPQNPPSFREVVEEYTSKLRVMTKVVSKSMAKCLELEENCFVNQFGEREHFDIRMNYYSPCQTPHLVMGLKPHADSSGYTLILQDEVQGLQILKNDTWLTVPTNPRAILVLIGDQMEIMTNGTIRSPVHRVVSNAKEDRISIAMFYTPETGKEIHPEDGLISDGNKPRLYKAVTDYVDKFFEFYNRGQRAIHIAQV